MRGFYGWYIVGCAFLIAVCGFGFGFYGPGVYLASLRTLHGWPTTLVSSAITLYYLFGATWIIFAGDVIERFGPRRIVLLGSCALGLGISLLPAAQEPWQIYPIFAVMSFGWASMSGAAINAIVAPWFEKRRGLAISLALNGASFGGVLVTPLLVLLIASLGFQRGLTFAAAGMLGIIAASAFVLRRSPAEMGLLPDGASLPGPDVAPGPGIGGEAGAWSRRAAFRDRAFLTISIPFALALLAQAGFLTHQISYLLQFFEPRAASLAVSLTMTAALVGRTLTGFFIDRLDRRAVSAANFALQAIGLGLLLIGNATLLIYAGCLIFGLGAGNVITLPSLIVQNEFPTQLFGRVVSLIVGVNQFTFAFGPTLLGGLRDWSGAYQAPFLFCMGLQIVAALVVLLGRKRPQIEDL